MSFLDRIHPERKVAGFTKRDGTLLFYTFVKAVIYKVGAKRVLDFGAGRGGPLHYPVKWFREMQDLRQSGADLEHDLVVGAGMLVHHRIDVIVRDYTFEHIEHPEQVAPELLRVLKPGGYICARTPNRYGYIKVAASLVPNRLHVRALNRIQPHREDKDVFPTVYKMNSVGQIRKLFPGCEVSWFRDSAEPSYYFGNGLLYRAFRVLHWVLPDPFEALVHFFIRKPPAGE